MWWVLLMGCASSVRTTVVEDVTVTTVRRGYANVHIVEHDETLVVFDAGYEEYAESVSKGLERAGRQWSDVDAIIVSHGHGDHAGGAPYLRDQAGAPIIIGEADVALTSTGTNGEGICPTSKMAERRADKDAAHTYTPFTPEVTVRDNAGVALSTLLETDGLSGEVLAESGHTGGSLIYVVGKTAFVGDLFRGSITGRRAVRHFYMCDLDENTEDVRVLLDGDARDVTTFFPGHFGPLSRDAVQAMVQEWSADES